VMARREASGGSMSSATEYFPRTPSVSHHPNLFIATHAIPAGVISSDEEEGSYFVDTHAGFPLGTRTSHPQIQAQFSPIDPHKVILGTYLMKRSKGRGRKLWKKRWFYLTSQGLTYTKSHMVSPPGSNFVRPLISELGLARTPLHPSFISTRCT